MDGEESQFFKWNKEFRDLCYNALLVNADELSSTIANMDIASQNELVSSAPNSNKRPEVIDNECVFDKLDADITADEIIKAIYELNKMDKSHGPDCLLNEFFIEYKDFIIPHLCTIFNAVLISGYFPSSWSDAILVPIFKSGDANDAANYRGISLVSNLDNQSLIVNPDCPTKIFTEYIHKKCNLPKDTMIDLTDENATQFDLFAKDPFESAFLLFQVRHTFLVCTVELYDDKSLKKITPILNDWEKKYPSLERKYG
ncbi:Hypothetical predicted protein [Mytilus galloprovincialis]|uniref:Reverse transcriptase domain-containing protein n=1 Tax=Mytilus galloprovincialis TaxID=29158 RepID=A0A8B6GT24_MYTGA|nr:Hypothetical predicted protein [Mytilus galloprovincialis]